MYIGYDFLKTFDAQDRPYPGSNKIQDVQYLYVSYMKKFPLLFHSSIQFKYSSKQYHYILYQYHESRKCL